MIDAATADRVSDTIAWVLLGVTLFVLAELLLAYVIGGRLRARSLPATEYDAALPATLRDWNVYTALHRN